MANIEKLDPSRTALLVMDFQPGILSRIEGADGLTAGARQAVALMRAAGATIAYVRIAFEDTDFGALPETSRLAGRPAAARKALHVDAPGTQIDKRVAPEPSDIVVRKVRFGAFSTTDLDQRLRARGVDTLVLAGVSTGGVVLSTVRDAHDRDYRLLVLADGCADPRAEVHEFLLEHVIACQAAVIELAQLPQLLPTVR